MNPTIGNQSLHRFARDVAANRIKSRQHHRVWRVINQHRHARCRFKRADVSPVAANDAAFDVVAVQRNRRRRGFESVIAGVALDCHRNNLPRFFLRFGFRFLDDFAAEIARVAQRLLLDFLDQRRARLRFGNVGKTLEFLAKLFLDYASFLFLRRQTGLLFFQ